MSITKPVYEAFESGPRERIGRCELCGLVDHHLVEGECLSCRRRYGERPDGAGLGDETRVGYPLRKGEH